MSVTVTSSILSEQQICSSMEVANKAYTNNLLKAQVVLMSGFPVPFYPELNPTLWQSAATWPVLSSAAAAAWLNKSQCLYSTPSITQNNMAIQTVQQKKIHKDEKISFSIDNIMTGKYEESRRKSLEDPSSPLSVHADGGLKYECDICSKTYSTFSGITKHKQFYCAPQSKKQFNCKYCDKTYFSLGALKMHIRTHTLPCKCKVCGKAFSRPWLLQGHLRTHTGEKPFKCQHCGRAFADRSNLRAHLQTHSEVKKYSCKRCDKTFSRMSLLLKHEENTCTTGMISLYN